jgi:hypothetical protein
MKLIPTLAILLLVAYVAISIVVPIYAIIAGAFFAKWLYDLYKDKE